MKIDKTFKIKEKYFNAILHLDTLFKNIKYIKIVSDFIDYNEYKNNLNNLKRIILQKIL